jgi:hypothetical protein
MTNYRLTSLGRSLCAAGIQSACIKYLRKSMVAIRLSATSSTTDGDLIALCGTFIRADYIHVDFTASWFVSTAACHARGLAVTHSRIQHHSGARYRALSTARGLDITSPLCAKAHAHDLQVRHQDVRLRRHDLRLRRRDF